MSASTPTVSTSGSACAEHSSIQSALSTTRHGGVSQGPYGLAGGVPGGLNLGTHVGDDPSDVARNRQRLAAQLPSMPRWLDQVHGCAVVTADHVVGEKDRAPQADASVAVAPGHVCAVMTADCLPVLLCDAQGTVEGAAHAGWRGLCSGVIEATLKRRDDPWKGLTLHFDRRDGHWVEDRSKAKEVEYLIP